MAKNKQPWPPDNILCFFGLTREEWNKQEEEISAEQFWNHSEVKHKLLEKAFEKLSILIEKEGL